jgi:MFS family permease
MPTLVAGLVSTPALWLMGRATTVGGLAMALTVMFFCGGVVLASNNITAGLCAKGSERGKVFGVLGLTGGLGALLGGALAGPIAARWGYASMYTILALISLLGPLTGLLWEERGVAPAPSPKTAAAGKGAGLGKSFYLLFAASLAGAVAGFVFFVGRSFVMTDLGFNAGALTTAGAIGGALALPVPLLAGCLSDRLGRKRFLAFSFLATTAALVALSASTALWNFWAASMLYTLSYAGGPVGSALVTDLVPRESLGRALALYNATGWLGGIAGCVLTGYAAQSVGITATLLAGACVPLMAAGLLAASASCQRPAKAPGRTDKASPVELQPAAA